MRTNTALHYNLRFHFITPSYITSVMFCCKNMRNTQRAFLIRIDWRFSQSSVFFQHREKSRIRIYPHLLYQFFCLGQRVRPVYQLPISGHSHFHQNPYQRRIRFLSAEFFKERSKAFPQFFFQQRLEIAVGRFFGALQKQSDFFSMRYQVFYNLKFSLLPGSHISQFAFTALTQHLQQAPVCVFYNIFKKIFFVLKKEIQSTGSYSGSGTDRPYRRAFISLFKEFLRCGLQKNRPYITLQSVRRPFLLLP